MRNFDRAMFASTVAVLVGLVNISLNGTQVNSATESGGRIATALRFMQGIPVSSLGYRSI